MTHEEAVNDLNVIKEFFEQESGAYPISLEYAIKVLKSNLSAGIAQGEWIDRSDGGRILHPWWESYECSQCKELGSGAWSFCPHCGAKMKGTRR